MQDFVYSQLIIPHINVTEFWIITLIGTPRIFETSVVVLIL